MHTSRKLSKDLSKSGKPSLAYQMGLFQYNKMTQGTYAFNISRRALSNQFKMLTPPVDRFSTSDRSNGYSMPHEQN